jgi:hypothetical protein
MTVMNFTGYATRNKTSQYQAFGKITLCSKYTFISQEILVLMKIIGSSSQPRQAPERQAVKKNFIWQ